MPLIKFSKMHGLGNDFLVINAISQPFNADAAFISQLANRHTGIGFDQLLVIEPTKAADFSCRIFNADGSEAEQCGNGMRCVARFLHEEGLSKKKSLTLQTKAGTIKTIIDDYDNIHVEMGAPLFEPKKIPFTSQQQKNMYEVDIKNQPVQFAALSMGNPHAILQVTSIKNASLELGAQLARHSAFPNGTNVGFMEIINRWHIRLRTYERGVGETFACGSNACAAVVAGIQNNLLDQKVKVELRFGNLWVEWKDKQSPVMLTGPASRVFDGIIK